MHKFDRSSMTASFGCFLVGLEAPQKDLDTVARRSTKTEIIMRDTKRLFLSFKILPVGTYTSIK